MPDFHFSERDDQVFPELFNKGTYVIEPGRPGRNAHNSTMKRLLGLDPNKHLPAAGLPPQTIQGIRVWVMPAGAPKMRTNRWTGAQCVVKSSTHRIMGECPHCSAVMSAGRLHQHKCK